MEAASRIELEIKDLQSSALPLGYAASTGESISTFFVYVKENIFVVTGINFQTIRNFKCLTEVLQLNERI